MIRRWLVAALLLCASEGALACPLAYKSYPYPSRLAVVAYLRQSPGADAPGVDLAQSASVTRCATTMPVLPQ